MNRALLALVAVLLAVVGANINDPYLVPGRGWLGPLVAVLGLAGAVLLRRRGWLLLALWLAPPLAVATAEGLFAWRKAGVLAAPAAQVLGRHFIVGYRDVREVEDLAARGLIGGVFVTRRNLAGRSLADLRAELEHLQALRRAADLPPLLVAADQEGGPVSHLSPWLPSRPGLASLAALPSRQRMAAARDLGRAHGRDLGAVGVNVNFAPVADLRIERGRNALDFHSLISRRASSADPAIAAELAAAYAEGLGAEGVRPTLKHFPGLGRVAEDTHHFRARLDLSPEQLEAADWLPFRQVLAAQPGSLVMVGHVVAAGIDPARPASHSRRVVQGLLRDRWGYGGLVVTDDMAMSPIYHHGLCDAVTEALNGGVDLLLMSFDGQQYYRAMDCAVTAWRGGKLSSVMLGASRARLANNKVKL
jgi:beta-N-acetylhexosaminidase